MRLVETFHGIKKRVVCNVLLEFAGWPFKKLDAQIRRILALGVFFLIFEAIQLVSLLAIQHPIQSVLIASLLGAFVAALCIYVVNWCYRYTCKQFEIALSRSPVSEDIERQISDWLVKATNPWVQILTALVITVIGLTSVYTIDRNIGFPFDVNVATYIALGLLGFFGGLGGYWGFVTPLITRVLSRGKLSGSGIDPLHPNKSPILVAISNILSACAGWFAFVISLCLTGVFALRPTFGTGRILYPLLFVFVGYAVSVWIFLYPQLNLARIVRHARDDTLSRIRREINRMYEQLDNLDQEGVERLGDLIELHSTVAKGGNTTIDLAALRSFIGSLAVPTVVAIIGVLDWGSILQKIGILP
jgi:hypothetical protein